MKTRVPLGSNVPWLEIGRLVFIVVLTVLFFLLGQSMVRHRFFQGGRQQWNGSIGQ
jgi:hypothetical protein